MNVVQVKVTFDDGNFIETRINTDEAGAREYYKIGSTFNLGSHGEDKLCKVTSVTLLANENK